MAEKIILEFSGWIELSEDTMFQYLGVEDNVPLYITAKEWLALPPDDDENGEPSRDQYILEDTIEAMRLSVDGSFDHHEVLLASERKELET
jgi:hypothetical protein